VIGALTQAGSAGRQQVLSRSPPVASIARVVVPGLPHHINQRRNRREPVFFGAEDYRLYRRLIAPAPRSGLIA